MKRKLDETKSAKRLKFEREIFSKSIKDIEEMISEEDAYHSIKALRKAHNSSLRASSTKPKAEDGSGVPLASTAKIEDGSSQYVPLIHSREHPEYDYDCVNISFLSSEDKKPKCQSTVNMGGIPRYTEPRLKRSLVPILPSQTGSKFAGMFDFDLKEDVKDLPRKINLEKDLKLMDQLVSLNSRLHFLHYI
ncbi:uncharacterized protein PRCAT00006221001 [Priceomyces carsonii]|uniref:uncharacterized protein n=1 Tax=Priceomyces carsonii TaxID=28549 RepID=UPI002EDAF9DA|nr:unnamed protein product [Priceomyces carsonii]